jgi:hypothetical protein
MTLCFKSIRPHPSGTLAWSSTLEDGVEVLECFGCKKESAMEKIDASWH